MAKSGTVRLGPWGGEGGNPWSHTLSGEISNIFITHDSNGVNSIRFISIDGSGATHNSGAFGVANGTEKEIKIDSKVEKLVSIEGSVGIYNSVKQVTSLGFTTSKTKHQPVGTGKKDTEFSCLLNEDPFIGFFGRSGTILNSIGISTVVKTRELVGPWPASAGGGPWGYTSLGPISLISVTFDDDIIRSLQFASQGADGVLVKSAIIGSANGDKTAENKIDTTVEKLIGITGTYGSYAGTTLLKSVTFITNNSKSFGPFGTPKDEDSSFTYSVQGDQVITGFHGQAGSLIDSIGVYIQPSKSSAKVGPFSGSGGGSAWSYEPQGLISRIFLTRAGAFHAIQFESIDEAGNKHTSKVFGTSISDAAKYTIEIERDDRWNSISGTTWQFGDKWYVSGLYFTTEKRKVYGPFGSEGKGIKFSFPVKDGYISGFHGVTSDPLHSIGIYVKPK